MSESTARTATPVLRRPVEPAGDERTLGDRLNTSEFVKVFGCRPP
jgi:hypothetical protein